MGKNVKWVIIFSVIILLCAGGILLSRIGSENLCAEVSVDGKVIRTVDDLITDKEKSFTVSTEYGLNEIKYCDGEIWVSSADCATKTCVNFGKISKVGQSIICAPHKLIITIVGKADKSADLTA